MGTAAEGGIDVEGGIDAEGGTVDFEPEIVLGVEIYFAEELEAVFADVQPTTES